MKQGTLRLGFLRNGRWALERSIVYILEHNFGVARHAMISGTGQ